ncbi:hypothetical protein BD626DRAFT_550636 [Schizophyllum amplum]|uniref:Selenoprotein O n=1 Tax=Schizophyllum amplum TaxID=97359 RepID=A0A550C1E0_9AGAR|nr:hypothetical protein BD626DRAFT_550636 [Auriculariopsis ampla]
MAAHKYSISALPLPPASHQLIKNLTPDAQTPSVAAFRNEVLPKNPSLQRRARIIAPQSHFSFVSPFPSPFPYDIRPPHEEEENDDNVNKAAVIEQWLAAREAVHPKPEAGSTGGLKMYEPQVRNERRELLGVSETGLRDCYPQLDVGDAFAVVGTPSLAVDAQEEAREPAGEDVITTRQELIDVLAGHAVLGNEDFAPWSMRYSGHQFGSWAGQLGDGRAISIHAVPHPNDPETTYEMQLKGAGRTPFSRSADGLAVVRSSIREYLASEAMQALGIATTRSLSLVSVPSIPVQRERIERACILTRMAPSFIRIGNFEALNPPMGNMMFFGGGQQRTDWEALRILGEWVQKRVLRLGVADGEAWGEELVFESARRNARMVAGWQAYGFMHGVINTDNVSILGLTIDYGPYAFMDVYDSAHICNHTDDGGRYAYKFQPNMIIYALRSLLNSLAPLIGAEKKLGGKAVSSGWAADASDEQIKKWKASGLELQSGLERVMQEECATEYGKLMRKRLGLRRTDPSDEATLTHSLLALMEDHGFDFHLTFRALCDFTTELAPPSEGESSSELTAFIDSRLLPLTPEPERLDRTSAQRDWAAWLAKYAARVRGEGTEWAGADRAAAMRSANPRFVLRQWVLEELIQRVEADEVNGRRALAKAMQMCCSPFQRWGAEGEERELNAEEAEERRFCGMGPRRMLGFQCSCSS